MRRDVAVRDASRPATRPPSRPVQGAAPRPGSHRVRRRARAARSGALFAAVVLRLWVRPSRVHPDMRFIPKCHWLRLMHLRVAPATLVLGQAGAAMMLASTIVPACSRRPWPARCALIVCSSASPS